MKKSLIALSCLLLISAAHGMENAPRCWSHTAPCASDTMQCATCNTPIARDGSCISCQLFPLSSPQGELAYLRGIKNCAICMVLAPRPQEAISTKMAAHLHADHGVSGMFTCIPCNITFASTMNALQHARSECPRVYPGECPDIVCNFCSKRAVDDLFVHICPSFKIDQLLEDQF